VCTALIDKKTCTLRGTRGAPNCMFAPLSDHKYALNERLLNYLPLMQLICFLLSLLVKKINFVRCTEPSASPREVTAIATGSQILQVSWKVCKRHVFAIYDTTFFVIYWNLWCFFQFSLPFLFRYEPNV